LILSRIAAILAFAESTPRFKLGVVSDIFERGVFFEISVEEKSGLDGLLKPLLRLPRRPEP
jgi:hypothetical protein